MAVYSIKDLEDLTGIKAHTLRIWEKRYGIIQPHRTKTNIRYYLDDDLKNLLNIVLLNKNGYKISKIADMSVDEINEQVAHLTDLNIEEQSHVDALAISLIELDSYKFEAILNHHITQEGLEHTMRQVIYPFLERLSLLWMSGSINQVHEHFLNLVVKQKILAATDNLPLRKNIRALKILLFLPRFSEQELSLLFMHYMLREKGFRTIYLGSDITVEHILKASEIARPDYLFTVCLDSNTHQWRDTLSLLTTHSRVPTICSGHNVYSSNQDVPSQLIQISGLDEVMKYLDSLVSEEAARS